MAVASSRITRQASANPVKSARKPLTERQRNMRSERYNIRLKGEIDKAVKRESGRITQENQRSATTLQNEREKVRTGESAVRIQQREAAILHRYREGIGIRRSERLQRNLIEEPATSVAQPFSATIIVFITVVFMLIILYAIINHSEGLSGALGGFANTIATFTQTGPLFTKNSSGPASDFTQADELNRKKAQAKGLDSFGSAGGGGSF